MNLSNNLKIYFLKYISRRKVCNLILITTPKLLVLMNQKIGDMIVCSPILREIKSAHPKAELHVLASEVNKEP